MTLDQTPSAPQVVFLHGLGHGAQLWDDTRAHLPADLRTSALDLPGHGLNRTSMPHSMGQLIAQVEATLTTAKAKDTVLVGLGLGGMIAQGLAVKRFDLVRALILTGTAARLGSKERWQRQIDQMRLNGPEKQIQDRATRSLYKPTFAQETQLKTWLNTPSKDTWINGIKAVQGTDFYTPTSGLRLPTLGLTGREDRITPPDLVRETIDLIPGSRTVLLSQTGHLPCFEAPMAYANALTTFLTEIGHVP